MSALSLIATLAGNIKPFEAAMGRAKAVAAKTGSEIAGKMKGSMAGMFGTAALGMLAKTTMDFGGKVADMSARVNVGTEALQEWFYAAKQTGAGEEDVAKFFEKIGQARGRAMAGNKQAIAQFQQLGVSVEDLGKMKIEDLGKRIADTVKNGDIQELVPALLRIGGESSTKLVAAFKGGVDEFGAEARRLGLIIDDETISKLDGLGDKAGQLMGQLAGPMAKLLGFVSDLLSGFEKLAQSAGAFSATLTWKDMVNPVSFFKKLVAFGNSQEKRDIWSGGSEKPAGAAGAPLIAPEEAKVEKVSELKKLEQQLFEIQERNYLKTLDKEEQLLALQMKRAALLEQIAQGKMTPEEVVKALIQAEELDGQIAGMKEGQKDGAGLGRLENDSLAQIGGRTGNSGANPMVTLSQQQLRHLQSIDRKTKPQSGSTLVVTDS